MPSSLVTTTCGSKDANPLLYPLLHSEKWALHPHLGSAAELTLLAGLWVNRPQDHEHGKVSSASHLKYGGLGWGETCSSATMTPVAGERASPEVIKAGELSLPFT